MVRVVGREHVAFVELVDPEVLESEAHRQRRGEHELRDAHRQRGEPALGVEDRRVALVALVQDRRGRRARHVRGHLEADGLHRAPDHLGRDLVDGGALVEATPMAGELDEIDVHDGLSWLLRGSWMASGGAPNLTPTSRISYPSAVGER